MKRIWLISGLLLLAALPAAPQAPASKNESADEKRERTLRLSDVLDALAVSAGSQVADVGAGDGTYVPKLAARVSPSGRVYAVDIDEKHAIPKLKELIEKQSLSNVSVVQSEPADPKLPENKLDAVLMVITYHEVEPYQEMLRHIMTDLKPGGRFVVVDMMPRKTRARPRADQVKNHVIDPEIAEAEFRAAGFEIVSRRDDFIDWPDEEQTRWMMICRRPGK